jgi:hypothetical protein
VASSESSIQQNLNLQGSNALVACGWYSGSIDRDLGSQLHKRSTGNVVELKGYRYVLSHPEKAQKWKSIGA